MSLVPVCDVCGARIQRERPLEQQTQLYHVMIGVERFEDACLRCETGLLRMLEALKDPRDPTVETLPAIPTRAKLAEGWQT